VPDSKRRRQTLLSHFFLGNTMSTVSPSVQEYAVSVSAEHEALRKVVRSFSEATVKPDVMKMERDNEMDRTLLRKAAELGVYGLVFPEAYGGAGADHISLVIAIEELARVSPAFSAAVAASYLVSVPIYLFGNEEQKRKYLVPLAKGDTLGAHAMTEPVAGSDIAGIQSRAERRGRMYYITGRKVFITNGDKADTFLVFARTGLPEPARRHAGITAFIVEKDTPGLKVGARLAVTGLRGEQPVELVFDNMEVSEENILGEVGQGAKIALSTYDRGRLGISAQGVGIAQAALERALLYAKERLTFERPILSYQQVQFKVAEMTIRVHTARLSSYWAASLADRGIDFVKAASIAKITSSEAAERNAHDAMLIMGAYGVAVDTGVEALLRDSQVIKTYEGTNDIQRLVIAREVAKEVGFSG